MPYRILTSYGLVIPSSPSCTSFILPFLLLSGQLNPSLLPFGPICRPNIRLGPQSISLQMPRWRLCLCVLHFYYLGISSLSFSFFLSCLVLFQKSATFPPAFLCMFRGRRPGTVLVHSAVSLEQEGGTNV